MTLSLSDCVMRDLYYILDEYRRRPVVVSKRRWRRWMQWNNENYSIGHCVIIGNAVGVQYYFRGRSAPGPVPPLVWRVEAVIPGRVTYPVPHFEVTEPWWKPDPAFGLGFEETRDYPTRGLAVSGYYEMRARMERRLYEYELRGGTLPPRESDHPDDGEEWKR